MDRFLNNNRSQPQENKEFIPDGLSLLEKEQLTENKQQIVILAVQMLTPTENTQKTRDKDFPVLEEIFTYLDNCLYKDFQSLKGNTNTQETLNSIKADESIYLSAYWKFKEDFHKKYVPPYFHNMN